jgi:hypothetical protein
MFVTIYKVPLNRLGYGDEIRQVEIKGVSTEIRLFSRQEFHKNSFRVSEFFPVLHYDTCRCQGQVGK